MSTNPIPANAIGIGLRGEHYQEVSTGSPKVDWFEVHSENYFGQGGIAHTCLSKIRNSYPLSFHGVGLSIGSTDSLNQVHLARLKELIDQYQPALVSEHLSWSSVEGIYLHDLLPLPMTSEVIQHLVNRIQQIQEYLGQRILVENASSYLEFTHSHMPEWEFISEIAQQSGCGLLLDVNNVFVNACNHNFDPFEYISGVSPELVGEMHVAGHTVKKLSNGEIRIDSHDQRVCDEVWDLYKFAVQRYRHAPTLIEWDKNLPDFSMLLDEAEIARSHQSEFRHAVA